ncbi:hypothetical protein OUZ56_029967 [Daphnia magna]|uniref:Uncharacterized protein n=1 Tax=Daphnia magna TaxID=35525 RepID=A0ABR0B8C6_9CRUS|nr:hypothetical protein OUZ56_029967 [Daphnia magna]
MIIECKFGVAARRLLFIDDCQRAALTVHAFRLGLVHLAVCKVNGHWEIPNELVSAGYCCWYVINSEVGVGFDLYIHGGVVMLKMLDVLRKVFEVLDGISFRLTPAKIIEPPEFDRMFYYLNTLDQKQSEIAFIRLFDTQQNNNQPQERLHSCRPSCWLGLLLLGGVAAVY